MPLPSPEPLTIEQSTFFADWYRGILETVNHSDIATAACLRPIDPETQAVAWRFLTSGAAGHNAAFRLLTQHQIKSHMFNDKGYPESVLLTKMLVLERIRDEVPATLDLANEADLAYTIHQALRGYCYHKNAEKCVQVYSVTTEGELSSLAAVTAFLHFASKKGYVNQYKHGDFKDAQGERVTGTRMASQRLKEFLVEYPEEIHRAIEYMSARDTAITVKDTKNLIKHLRESEYLGAMDNGWL